MIISTHGEACNLSHITTTTIKSQLSYTKFQWIIIEQALAINFVYMPCPHLPKNLMSNSNFSLATTHLDCSLLKVQVGTKVGTSKHFIATKNPFSLPSLQMIVSYNELMSYQVVLNTMLPFTPLCFTIQSQAQFGFNSQRNDH